MRHVGRNGSLIGHIPWVGRYAKLIPGIGGKVRRFQAFSIRQLERRASEGSQRKDLYYHLVRNYKSPLITILSHFRRTLSSGRRSGYRETAGSPSNYTLRFCSRHHRRSVTNGTPCTVRRHLRFRLGSDTTATVLASLFFYLLRDPKAFERLRAEIDKFYTRGEEITTAHFHEMHYLEACANEALRLSPAVPSGSQRGVIHPDPSRGKMVGP